jgi:hypothetical protein
MKRLFFLLISIPVFFSPSCTRNSGPAIESEEQGLYVVDLDDKETMDMGGFFQYSTLYKGGKTIMLETNESCLIGSITKMRVSDQFIFILDALIAKSLYVFDKNGRFIRKIGNLGNGPEEYTRLSDFTIDKENNIIYLLNSYPNRIYKYDATTGRFIQTINLEGDVRSYNIEYAGGGKLYADAYFSNHSDQNYLLRVIEESSGKEVTHYLNVMEYNKGISNTNTTQHNVFHFRKNGNIVFVQQFMDHIIEITEDRVSSLVDIKSKDVVTAEDIKTAMERNARSYMNEVFQLNKYYSAINFVESGNHALFHYQKGFNFFTILLDKQTNKSKCYRDIWNDLLSKERGSRVPFPMLGCSDSNGAFCYIASDLIPRLKAKANDGALHPDLDRLDDLKNMAEDANPVIFYYEYKD